jgi:hypothetical protein
MYDILPQDSGALTNVMRAYPSLAEIIFLSLTSKLARATHDIIIINILKIHKSIQILTFGYSKLDA